MSEILCNFAAELIEFVMNKLATLLTRIIDWFYPPFRRILPLQLFRYAACGGGNMVFDWVLYFLLYNFVIGHDLVYLPFGLCLTPHVMTLCVVFPITLLTGFWLNKHITFSQSTLQSTRQLLRYMTIVLTNLLIIYVGLKFCVEVLGWYPTPSKMLMTMITVVISFFAQKYFSFR